MNLFEHVYVVESPQNYHLVGHTKVFTFFLSLNLPAILPEIAPGMPQILSLKWQLLTMNFQIEIRIFFFISNMIL